MIDLLMIILALAVITDASISFRGEFLKSSFLRHLFLLFYLVIGGLLFLQAFWSLFSI